MSPPKVSSRSVHPARTSSASNGQTDDDDDYGAADPLAGATSSGGNVGPRMGGKTPQTPPLIARVQCWASNGGETPPNPPLFARVQFVPRMGGKPPQTPQDTTPSPREWPFLLPQSPRFARGLITPCRSAPSGTPRERPRRRRRCRRRRTRGRSRRRGRPPRGRTATASRACLQTVRDLGFNIELKCTQQGLYSIKTCL